MDDAALKTLFLPFESGALAARGTALFCGAQDHPALEEFGAPDCVQHWAGPAARLKVKDYSVFEDIPDHRSYALALCLLPKQKEEALGMLARAAQALEDGGFLVAAAANDAGGNRIEKWFKELGAAPQSLSKNKARAVWANGPFDQNKMKDWIEAAAPREIEMGGQIWRTQPGIFGWNKIDAGSKLLADPLPEDLSGDVADFGCGYGYLSRRALEQNKKIKSLTAIDADARAVKILAQNVDGAAAIQADLTAPQNFGKFGAILMNPPFHAGKSGDSDIGLAFIKTAYAHLLKNGALYMVANAHLPYEKALSELFTKTEKIKEAQGFKVFKAIK